MAKRLTVAAAASVFVFVGCDQLPAVGGADLVELNLAKDGIYSQMEVTSMEYAFYRAEFARFQRAEISSVPNELLDEHFEQFRDDFRDQNAYPGAETESDPGYLQVTSALCSVFNMVLAEQRPGRKEEYHENARAFAEVARDVAITRYRPDSDPTGLYLNPSETYAFHVLAIDEIRKEFERNEDEIPKIEAYCTVHQGRLPEVASEWWK